MTSIKFENLDVSRIICLRNGSVNQAEADHSAQINNDLRSSSFEKRLQSCSLGNVEAEEYTTLDDPFGDSDGFMLDASSFQKRLQSCNLGNVEAEEYAVLDDPFGNSGDSVLDADSFQTRLQSCSLGDVGAEEYTTLDDPFGDSDGSVLDTSTFNERVAKSKMGMIECNSYQIQDDLNIGNDNAIDRSSRRGLIQTLKQSKPETIVQIPDLSDGIGKSRSKRNLVDLHDFICSKLVLTVYESDVYCYNGRFWKLLPKKEFITKSREVLKKENLTEALGPKDYSNLYELVSTKPELEAKQDFDPPADLLNFLDGTLDLNSLKLYPHDEGDHFRSCLAIKYKDVKRARFGKAFEDFVSNASNGNPDVRKQILELIALALTGVPVKRAYMFVGPSNTGKSQIGRFLIELLGRENAQTISGLSDFANRFTTSTLVGKSLAACLDLPDAPLPMAAIGTIKQLVGDDALKVEQKYKSGTTIFRKPLLLLASNHPIRIPDSSNEKALLNRFVFIPFLNPVAATDMRQELYKDLLEEAPYIVGEAIKAYRELSMRNFQVTLTELPEEYRPRDSREEVNAVQAFIENCCIIDPAGEVSTKEFYRAFLRFSKDEDLEPCSETDFSRIFSAQIKSLPNIRYEKRVGKFKCRGYRGLRLIDNI